MENRSGDRDTLLLARRELVTEPILEFMELQFFHRKIDSLLQPRSGQAVEPPEIFKSLNAREPSVKRSRRREKSDVGSYAFGIGQDAVSTDLGCAPRRLDDRREHSQECRLASSIDPQKAEDFALICNQVDVFDRMDDAPLGIREFLADALGANHSADFSIEWCSDIQNWTFWHTVCRIVFS